MNHNLALLTCTAALCALPSCNPAQADPITVGPDKSGTRIKRLVHVGEDGVRAAAGWWDSKLETECEWLHDAKGTIRCMPARREVAFDSWYYPDPACKSTAYAAGSQPGCPRKFAARPAGKWPGRECQRVPEPAQGYEYYRLAQVLTVYEVVEGACVPARPTGLFYTATPMDPSEFVAAQVQIETP